MGFDRSRLNNVVRFVRLDLESLSDRDIREWTMEYMPLWGCKFPPPGEKSDDFRRNALREVQSKMDTILRQQIRLEERGTVDPKSFVKTPPVKILGFDAPQRGPWRRGGRYLLLEGSWDACLFWRTFESAFMLASGHEDLRICPSCDRLFLSRRKDQAFCTRQCLWRAQKKRRRETPEGQAYERKRAQARQAKKRQAARAAAG